MMGPSFYGFHEFISSVCMGFLNCVCHLLNSGFHFDWAYGEGGGDGVVGG